MILERRSFYVFGIGFVFQSPLSQAGFRSREHLCPAVVEVPFDLDLTARSPEFPDFGKSQPTVFNDRGIG